MDKSPVPENIARTHKLWYRVGCRIQFLLVTLGVISIIASISVTAFTRELGDLGTRVVAALAAIATAGLSSFGLVGRNRDIWGAWRTLSIAILRYENEETYTAAQLIAAYDIAERTLGDVGFEPGRPAAMVQREAVPEHPAPEITPK